MTPPALDRVVKKCLAKDADDRWQTARDLWHELKWIVEGGGEAGAAPEAKAAVAKGWRQALPVGLVAIVSLAVGAAMGAWMLRPTPPLTAQAPAHVTITLPPGDRLAAREYPPLAFSPDGSHLVYVAIHNNVQQLFVRAMGSHEATPLPGTEGGRGWVQSICRTNARAAKNRFAHTLTSFFTGRAFALGCSASSAGHTRATYGSRVHAPVRLTGVSSDV